MTETAPENVVSLPRTTAPLAVVPSAPLRRFEPLAFTEEQRVMMRDTLLNGASEAEAGFLIEVARLRGLNPITRQIHFVKRWDNDKNRYVWAYQTSIDGLRSIAERTGLYDGQDEPDFERDAKGAPMACRVRVYRKDVSRAFVGVAYFTEYVQTKKNNEPNIMWATKPHIMLAKCAEALALRKAFPEDTGGLYTDDEIDVTPREHPAPPPARPMVPLAAAAAAAPPTPAFDVTAWLDRVARATTGAELKELRAAIRAVWDTLTTDEKALCTKELDDAIEAGKARAARGERPVDANGIPQRTAADLAEVPF